ncbi:hypothetical protein SJAV_07960 [Sulfurisphaera javensis]|uniref:A-type ATP synthase subunit I n=1 Tax=Sulfurisphaera javensis TaxID=2049879 RepID=A0AAT9GPN0_9CREN
MGIIFPDKMKRVFIIANLHIAEKLVLDILNLGVFQPEKPIYSKIFNKIEYVDEYLALVKDYLTITNEIISFYSFPIKRTGELKFDNLSNVIKSLSNDVERIKHVYEKIIKLKQNREQIEDLYTKIEEYKAENLLIELNNLLIEEKELQNYLRKIKSEIETEVISLYNKLLTIQNYLEILFYARKSRFFFFLEGYVKEKAFYNFKAVLMNKYSKNIIIEAENPVKYVSTLEPPPTSFSSSRIIKPFEVITKFYGTPNYWEINPAIVYALAFPLFFSLMFPDAGNGVILFIFSLLLYKYSKNRNNQDLSQISIVLAISSFISIIFGLIDRDFFGPLLVGGVREIINSKNATVGPLYNLWPIPSYVSFNLRYLIPFGIYSIPEISLINGILISISVGIIFMVSTIILGIINLIYKYNFRDIFLDYLPSFIVYFSVFLLFAYGFVSPFQYFYRVISILSEIEKIVVHFPDNFMESSESILSFSIIIGVLIGLIYGSSIRYYIYKSKGRKGVKTSLLQSFIEGFFDPLIVLISNIISFIRLIVLGLAHYYLLYAFSYFAIMIAGSFNTLQVLTNPSSLFILVLGNLIAIALEGTLAFIQSLRLNLYELSGKFCRCDGRPFTPKKAYVSIKE